MVVKPHKPFKVLSAVMAFLLWGGWAFYVNSKESFAAGLLAGFTQGIASFMITLFMVHAVTCLFLRIAGQTSRLVLPAVVTVAFTGSCLAGLHYLAGTPSILPTIAPALTVAFAFCIYTAFKLQKTAAAGND